MIVASDMSECRTLLALLLAYTLWVHIAEFVPYPSHIR